MRFSRPTTTAATAGSLDRRAAWLTLLLGTAVVCVLAAVLVPWEGGPSTLAPVPVGEVLTPAQADAAEARAVVVRSLVLGSQAVSLALLLALGLTPAGARLVRRTVGRAPWWLAVPAVALALEALTRAVTLPLGLLLRRRNLDDGLTTQSLAGWLADRGLGVLVAGGVGALVVLVVVGTARRFPRRWFLPAGGLLAAAVLVGSAAYPLVVEPAFNDFEPLPDGRFKDAVIALADREGVRVDDVLVSDASRRTTTYNAYVSGIGATRRIVVYDNLLELPRPQVLSIIAHEVAHARHHDVARGTAIGALAAWPATALLALLLDVRRVRRRAGVGAPADVAVTPLVVALVAVGGLLVLPAQNAVSRAIEVRADRAALAATEDPAAFREVQRRLAVRSLADPTPPALWQAWFGSHPTVLQRWELADR